MIAIRKSLSKAIGVAVQHRSIPTTVGLTLCAGVIVSVAISILVWDWERERGIARWEQQGDRLSNSLQAQIDRNFDLLWELSQFYGVSGTLKPQTFQELAKSSLARHPNFQSLAWIAPVVGSDPQQETAPQQGENASPGNVEPIADANGIAADPTARRFAVAQIEPSSSEFLAIGMDLETLMPNRTEWERAQQTGELVVSEAIAQNDRAIVLSFMPVYERGTPDSASKGENLQGAILGVISVGELLESAIAPLELTDATVCLWEIPATDPDRFLNAYRVIREQINSDRPAPNGSELRSVFLPESECKPEGRFAIERRVRVGQHQWAIAIQPASTTLGGWNFHWRSWTILSAALLWTILPFAIFASYLRRSDRMKQLLPKLSQANDELSKAYSEITLLNHMSDLLQACLTVEEAQIVISTLVKPLFPECSGAIFTIHSSKNLVEAIFTWGNDLASETVFSPDRCLSLRRGQPYWVKNTERHLLCQHRHQTPHPGESVCIPMVAQGEILGVLYLSLASAEELTETKYRLAGMVARQIAMAFANLKLRETLTNQSIRDPLTNLFNRRYMEESLEREIRRAQRHHHEIGIIMLDVDHFKQLNDTYGHDAGDAILRELALFLQKQIRSSDIACRYGGEEFTLILPEAPVEVTYQRAQQLCESVKRLSVEYRQQSFGVITVSIGVASFPENGTTGMEVIKAADTALYRAKQEGRDRVAIALT